MDMNNKIRFPFILILTLTFVIFTNRCDVVQQTQQMANLVKCDFRIASVQNLNLAGVNIQNVQSLKSLNIMDAAKIMAAVAGNSFPLLSAPEPTVPRSRRNAQ